MSYLTSDATADCKDGTSKIDGIRQGSGQEDIFAVVTKEDCEATLANFYVELNYEAMEFVGNDTTLQVYILLNTCRYVALLISEKEP